MQALRETRSCSAACCWSDQHTGRQSETMGWNTGFGDGSRSENNQLKHTFPLPNNAFSIPAQLTDAQKYLHYQTEPVHYRQVSECTSTKQVIFHKRTLSLKHFGQYSKRDVCNHEHDRVQSFYKQQRSNNLKGEFSLHHWPQTQDIPRERNTLSEIRGTRGNVWLPFWCRRHFQIFQRWRVSKLFICSIPYIVIYLDIMNTS